MSKRHAEGQVPRLQRARPVALAAVVALGTLAIWSQLAPDESDCEADGSVLVPTGLRATRDVILAVEPWVGWFEPL